MLDTASLEGLAFPLFGALTTADLAAMRPLLHRRQFKAGAVVFQRGDPADDVYLIVSGQLRISVGSEDGREVAFRIVGAGEMVGELGVLDGSHRSADLTALRDSVLLGLGRPALQNLLATRPTMASGVIRFLCKRLRETSEQLETLALQRVEVRLARLLLRLAHAAAPVQGEVELTLDMSQAETAALIGASRPKVNLAFAELEARGAIRRAGRKLRCRLAALGELAEVSRSDGPAAARDFARLRGIGGVAGAADGMGPVAGRRARRATRASVRFGAAGTAETPLHRSRRGYRRYRPRCLGTVRRLALATRTARRRRRRLPWWPADQRLFFSVSTYCSPDRTGSRRTVTRRWHGRCRARHPVLGFVLETANSGQNLPSTPILLRSPLALPGVWRANGIVGPLPELADAAQGFGALVAAADPDGPIRRVPLLVLAGGVVRPGLAVELVRLAQGAGALLIEPGGILHVGDIALPLDGDARRFGWLALQQSTRSPRRR